MHDDRYHIAYFHDDHIIDIAGPEGEIYLYREQSEQSCMLTIKECGKTANQKYFQHSKAAFLLY